jgi:hypothetical protein
MFITTAGGGMIAGTLLGGIMGGSSSGGGGGTQKQDRSPWATAQPWLTHNLVRGEGLQANYQDNPFNAIQQASYGNALSGNDYINRMVPGLLSQMSQPTGFDRNNPRARPAPFSFPGMNAANYQPVGGLLGVNSQGMNQQANPWAGALQGLRSGMPQDAASGGAAPAPGMVQGMFGPAPAPAPGAPAAAAPAANWQDWLAGLNSGGSN